MLNKTGDTAGRSQITARGLQTVFRIKGTKARQQSAAHPGESSKSVFNARRSHKKSRTGCQNCKLRRVKCDETRIGGCLKCRYYGVDCDYLTMGVPEAEKPMSNDGTPVLTPSGVWTAALTPISTTVTTLYPSLHRPTPFDYDLPVEITPYWQTLGHFEIFTCPTISTPEGQRIFGTSVLAIASQKDYLMHAVLGTSAAHLAWQARLQHSPIEQRQHQRAEAYHWHRAVARFRSELGKSEQRTTETVDALISTCMLLGIHSYLVSNDEDVESFVWASDDKRPEALRWLSLQSGFSVLLRSIGDRAAVSVWLDVFSSAAADREGLRPGLNLSGGICRDFLDLCAIDRRSNSENNPYFSAVQDMFALLQMGPPTMTNLAFAMAFMGRLVGPFQELLIKRDPAALLIVAYWLALVYQLHLWWIQERARRECVAIIEFLGQDGSPRIQRLLEYPASVMGIDLSCI